ncbi:MAG: hypothetical protein H0U53_05045 [Actinobacteria bacterium]|nr:hypothetical protein [Actinomycetota bacterium]
MKGEFQQLAAAPTGYDPETEKFTAVGIASVTGDLAGFWVEHLKFTIDPLTGNAKGTSDQTFYGRASDGTSGTLRVFERIVTIDGATHVSHAEGKILGGTGDWKKSSGYYWADGFLAGPTGVGDWCANWVRPRRG